MASLNLIPDPMVLGAQIGLFLANFVAVKKLFVKPYLLVRDRRLALTIGSQEEATEALVETDRISRQIDQAFSDAAAQAKSERDAMRAHVESTRSSILTAAEAAAKSTVTAVEQQIRAELAEEKSKVPAVVKALTEEVLKVALS